MTTLSKEKMELYVAGDFIDGACAGLTASAGVYTLGAVTNAWNPVGWVSGGFAVAGVACSAYWVSSS